jgi:hypothetical protein
MASGSIILNDGRCWSDRWTGYDCLLSVVIDEIRLCGDHPEFMAWLRTRIPEEQDIEMGYGFIKPDTDENIVRSIDLRELTPASQEVFWSALQRAATKLIVNPGDQHEHLLLQMKRLLHMHHLVRIGDPPDHLSDWRTGYVEPPSGEKIGPGW